MTVDACFAPALVLSSLVPAVVIFCLGEELRGVRTALNVLAAVVKLVLVGVMLWGVFHGHAYETRLPMLPGVDLLLRADALGMFFVALSATLWLLTTVYAIGYLEDAPHRSRFFGFFSLVVASTMGIALAGNLVTFLVFYEMLTLATYPLVVHRGTPEALRGGVTYLTYTMGGGALVLVGIAWLTALAGPIEFRDGGVLRTMGLPHGQLIAIFAVLVAGLGVKAALVPFHRWLPAAMVAPAPVSALLHAVAVVKAGAFGIARVVYNVYGIEFAWALGVTPWLEVLAAATILWGSVRALAQDDLKRRLAYSTVSQVAYITLGVATIGPLGTLGGLVHLVHQGIMKVTLFFCAGNLAETLHIHKVSEMRGVARRMPWTMAAFTVGAFGMIGVPPVAGFVTKWYLGLDAVDSGTLWVLAVLAASTLLNAAYFLPIVHAAWFLPADVEWAPRHGRLETSASLLVPTVVTAVLSLLAGLLAGAPWSPLAWARLIIAREYTS